MEDTEEMVLAADTFDILNDFLEDGGRATRKTRSERASKYQKRAARKVLDKLSNVPRSSLSRRQVESLSWAKRTIAALDEESSPVQTARRTSTKTASKTPSSGPTPAKQSKIASDQAKAEILITIVDEGNPDDVITADKWKLVEVELLKVFKSVLEENPGEAPVCRDTHDFHGAGKQMRCANERSVELFKQAITELGEVWPGASLAVVENDSVAKQPRTRTWLPIEPSTSEEVLALIRLSNPELSTDDWVVGGISEVRGSSRSAVILVNEESMAALAEANWVINYGFTSINLKNQ